MTRFIALMMLVSFVHAASAQNPYGIKLNPGERLVSVNGVAVNSMQSQPYQGPQQSSAITYMQASQPMSSGGSMNSGSDQQRAQAEANYMAQHGITGHVGGTIGSFEGCGWASSGTPSTCTPSHGMTLTADAIAHGRGGVYRVRAWR